MAIGQSFKVIVIKTTENNLLNSLTKAIKKADQIEVDYKAIEEADKMEVD